MINSSLDVAIIRERTIKAALSLVDAETGEILRRFVGLQSAPWSLDVSSDEQYVIGNGSPVILWDLKTGNEIRRFDTGEWAGGWNVVFSPDGQTVFSSSLEPEGEVIEWQIADRSLDELRAWVHANRYVRDLTCDERAQYNLEPLCE